MSDKLNYSDKFDEMLCTLPVSQLTNDDLHHLKDLAHKYLFSFQDVKKVVDISTDLKMWQAGKLSDYVDIPLADKTTKQFKKKAISKLETTWSELKSKTKSYNDFNPTKVSPDKIKNLIFKESEKSENTTILGKCPVASEKTLCCNLETLDVVDNCGFECSYCSIQSFFPNNTILVENQLVKKLNNLTIDPNKRYHIGTGQSSDSLMWGNKGKILDQLMDFARKHPNIILEFKTKSKNISYFLNNEVPKNIICTWSLNPNIIIENEEHHAATLEERIQSARKLADKGILVGFHLHPIIYYDSYKNDYQDIANQITSTFKSSEVAMVSMGTLTFTKPVLKEIRKKKIYSKILQMELVEASGKLSYPEDVKTEMFKTVYDSFSSWHKEVFIYLCMEDHTYWPKVFGYSYKNNIEFETAMKDSYFSKV